MGPFRTPFHLADGICAEHVYMCLDSPLAMHNQLAPDCTSPSSLCGKETQTGSRPIGNDVRARVLVFDVFWKWKLGSMYVLTAYLGSIGTTNLLERVQIIFVEVAVGLRTRGAAVARVRAHGGP